ncbi:MULTISPECIES: LPS translocon maturation chaperone LptM [Gallibacterium]|uniref:Lipoprotein n=1 Tax=Gallibacterium genomosp. 1 TaxID=155515 RepID=A0A0A2Y8Z8_9PAST|nr:MULTISPECIES: lipoprotein [Gallibacterium]KGQ39080.1 lipoprotein [Gallibacterium genomosp. 1]KGQ48119.1 lipoprotein [Gallibacterium anatis 10672-6]MDK9561621.1 lipoprotein [Gallibacterium anatis]OBW98007.1 lipoprotein [Gallibacterium genomosp. 1]OBX01908.1 lipoprotein [Gallibacterium genomosp. 1]
MKKLLLTLILGSFFLTACGVKGPLYMPPDDNAQQQQQTQ